MKLNTLYTDYYKEYLKSITINSEDCKTVEGIEIYKSDSTKGLGIDLGFGEYDITLGTTHNSVVIGGENTNNTVNIIIYNLLLRYSPKELNLYILDPRYTQGNSFSSNHIINRTSYEVKNGSDFTDILCSDLDILYRLLQDRYKLFRDSNCDNFIEYRKLNNKLPRIVVVCYSIDDFTDKNYKNHEKYESLLRLGRDAGISIIFVADNGIIQNSLLNRYGHIGICTRTNSLESEKILGNDEACYLTRNNVALIRGTSKQLAIVNIPYISKETKKSIENIL